MGVTKKAVRAAPAKIARMRSLPSRSMAEFVVLTWLTALCSKALFEGPPMRPKRVEPRALPCRFGLVAEPEDFGSLLKREGLRAFWP